MDEKMLDRISQAYKGELGEQPKEDAYKRIDWIQSNVKGDTVLDVGCSQGITSILLAKEGKTVVGIDSERSRIEYAENDKVSEGIGDNLTFVCDDFLSHKFDSKFDCVIMGEVLEHVFSPVLFLEKARDLLTENGRLIVTVPFGINPFPDHKRTYYFLEIFRQINERIYVSDIVFIESWLGLFADLSNKESKIQFDENFIEKLEDAFFKIDSRKQAGIDRVLSWHNSSNAKVETANKKINELEATLKKIKEQNEEQINKLTSLKEKYDQNIGEKEKDIYNLKLLLNEKTIKLDTLRADYSARTEDLNKITSDYSDVLTRSYDLEYENKIKEYELKSLREENELTKRTLQEASSKLEEAQSDLATAKEGIEVRNKKNRDAEGKISSLELEIEKLNKTLLEYEARKEASDILQQELAQLSTELSEKEQDIKEKEELILSLESEIKEEKMNSDETVNALNELQAKTAGIEDKLVKAQAGVESRNKRIKTAEEKINMLLKENAHLKNTVAEYNTMLYQAKRLNAAYERFPSIKAYNWLRKFRHRRQENTLVSEQDQAIKHEDNKSAKSEPADIKRTSDVSSEPQTGNSNPTQEKKVSAESKEIKFDMLFSDFQKKAIAETSVRHKEFILRKDCDSLKKLKVACIMDEFTYSCFAPECVLRQLTPENWKNEINEFKPDMLFVESAWQGIEGKWHGMIVHVKPEFCQLTEYCHQNDIPVVFWCKEDPGWNDAFMAAAGLADYIFTTEIDCITQYKKNLGNNNVYLLHFAAQPKFHNPVETEERIDKFCFAGSYYTNYPERTKAFDNIAHYAMRVKGLDIFDRNFNDEKAVHKFPEFYKPFILGKLEPEEIDKAYKRYTYNINANSGTWTQIMFARRVFELLASNTVSVGNYSKGQKNLFGDLCIMTNDVDQLDKNMHQYCWDTKQTHKYRLQGFRKVTAEDLYEDRLGYIVQKVFDITLKKELPEVTVISLVENDQQTEYIRERFNSQNYTNARLIVIEKETDIKKFIAENVKNGFIAYFDKDDYYGEDYLYDMAMMLRYDDYDAIGKSTYYDGDGQLQSDTPVYHKVESLSIRRSIVKASCLEYVDFENGIINNADLNMVSIHEFDYIQGSNKSNDIVSSSMDIADRGKPYNELEKIAENITLNNARVYSINVKDIFADGKYNNIILEKNNSGLDIKSSLQEGQHQYIYDNKLIKYDISDKEYSCVIFQGDTALDVMLALICYDANKNRLDTIYVTAGLSKKINLPQNTSYFSCALRVKGAGESTVGSIRFNNSSVGYEDCFIAKSNVLVLTNIYPAYDDLYRNAFVHQRVKGYKEQGLNVDVMCFNNVNPVGYREFDGIDVATGFTKELEAILRAGNVDTVCVHFLNEFMWEVLKNFKDKIRIIIWCHGSEIQPWWRRKFNYSNAEELKNAQNESEKRYALWQNIFKTASENNMQFVFVSDYFRKEVFDDYKVNLNKDKYVIIPNYINTDLFNYIPKTAEQRKKILSIRPFGSNKYANDLSVLCIKELANKPFFNDLTFHIIGKGRLFEPIMAELNQYTNVIAENRFLKQDEIAELHKENGIFLVPTRMDSQGVSRDEAMSSGLVPVTNAVTAIPEFVDDNCGILAPDEDYIAMASGIENLYKEPELFLEMSKNSAERVRNQSSFEHTIKKEIDLITEENND